MLMPTLPKAADLPPPFLLLPPKLGDAIEELLPVAQMMCADLPRAQGLPPSPASLFSGAPNLAGADQMPFLAKLAISSC
jgi:hypothetical protein